MLATEVIALRNKQIPINVFSDVIDALKSNTVTRNMVSGLNSHRVSGEITNTSGIKRRDEKSSSGHRDDSSVDYDTAKDFIKDL